MIGDKVENRGKLAKVLWSRKVKDNHSILCQVKLQIPFPYHSSLSTSLACSLKLRCNNENKQNEYSSREISVRQPRNM
jgi:hypothetical protein